MATAPAAFTSARTEFERVEVVVKGGHVSLVAGANTKRRLRPKLVHWQGVRST